MGANVTLVTNVPLETDLPQLWSIGTVGTLVTNVPVGADLLAGARGMVLRKHNTLLWQIS